MSVVLSILNRRGPRGRRRGARRAPFPRAGLAGALALLAPGYSACAPGPAPLPVASIELRLEGAPRAAAAEGRLVRLDVPEGLEPWRVAARRWRVASAAELDAGPADARALLLLDVADKEIVVPGPFAPRGFNRVAVLVSVLKEGRLDLALRRAGEDRRTRSMRLPAAHGVQRIAASFADAASESEAIDEIALRIGGDAGPIAVHALELEHLPLADWPFVRDGYGEAGGELRPAHQLAAGQRLTGRFRAGPRQELELAYAIPAELQLAGWAPALAVELGGERVPLPAPGDPLFDRWHTARLALGEIARGEPGPEIRIEIEDAGRPEAVFVVAEPRLVTPAADPPLTLLVTSDTHRGDHVGAAQLGVDVDTPVLDALAARGVFFERCHSTSNVTVPSHVALMTGTHPRDTRVVDNLTALADEAATLAERFRARGWRTFAALSARHLSDIGRLAQGFERFAVPRTAARDGKQTVLALEGMLDGADRSPVFAWLHLYDAHAPYAAPPEFEARYTEREVAGPTPGISPQVSLGRARYRGEVSYVDDLLGRVLARPRVRSGVIAVTADHGEVLGQHGIEFNHSGLYTDTVHVPLILVWPGGPRGLRVREPVGHLDLGRTLLELSGVDPAGFPGRSFANDVRATPLFALGNGARSASISAGGWHLVLYLVEHAIGTHGRRVERHEYELFHLADDPGCERDLARTEREQAARMRAALVAWLADARDLGLARAGTANTEELAQLAELGYATESAVPRGAWIDPGCECGWCAGGR